MQVDRLTTERDSLRKHLDAKGKQFDDSEASIAAADRRVADIQKELARVVAERDALGVQSLHIYVYIYIYMFLR